MMMTESLLTAVELTQFSRWFKRRHGDRPSSKTLKALTHELERAQHTLDLIVCERSEALRWDRERMLAMRGWEARSKPRPGKRGHNAQ